MESEPSISAAADIRETPRSDTMVGRNRLIIYLSDHLAGAVAAVSIIDDLSLFKQPEFQAFLIQLKARIESDQASLRSLLRSLDGEESPLKNATAWLAQKISRLKLQLADTDKQMLGRVEALEILELGIEGKRLLWRLVGSLPPETILPERDNLARLINDAQTQRDDVEYWRIACARAAFSP